MGIGFVRLARRLGVPRGVRVLQCVLNKQCYSAVIVFRRT